MKSPSIIAKRVEEILFIPNRGINRKCLIFKSSPITWTWFTVFRWGWRLKPTGEFILSEKPPQPGISHQPTVIGPMLYKVFFIEILNIAMLNVPTYSSKRIRCGGRPAHLIIYWCPRFVCIGSVVRRLQGWAWRTTPRPADHKNNTQTYNKNPYSHNPTLLELKIFRQDTQDFSLNFLANREVKAVKVFKGADRYV
jgi:hypothetical protein